MTLLTLLLAHFIGDYALQNDYIALNKGKDNYILFAHVAIWTFVMTATGMYLHLDFTPLHVILILMIPHFAADYIKARGKLWTNCFTENKNLFIDQTIHFVQIIIFWLLVA